MALNPFSLPNSSEWKTMESSFPDDIKGGGAIKQYLEEQKK